MTASCIPDKSQWGKQCVSSRIEYRRHRGPDVSLPDNAQAEDAATSQTE